jgi:GrpB-like predicted nucleotidyltransferase (UPF0157 family)
MSLGLPHNQNFLVPYDSEWVRLFEEERTKLRSVLPTAAIDIQHIGSTAVPGLRAKPIIDIAIAAVHFAMADEWLNAMASLGYDYPGDIGLPEHRVYGREREVRRFLVHVVNADKRQWRRYIHFRDRLRADPQLAAEYEALKLNAAAKYPTGRASYQNAKASFIEEVLATL